MTCISSLYLKKIIAISEGSFKLSFLSKGPPLSLFHMISQKERFRELDVPFVVRLFKWFFCLLGHGSFLFLLCILTFWGALIYVWLAGFHHHTFHYISYLMKQWLWCPFWFNTPYQNLFSSDFLFLWTLNIMLHLTPPFLLNPLVYDMQPPLHT
jgi:hypothetical protein